MKKSFFVLVFVFAIVLLLTTVGVAGEGMEKGKEKVDVCHITGVYDDVPIGHVINIAKSALPAHIKHGDPEVWEVVTLPDGKEVCIASESLTTTGTSGTPYKMSRPHLNNTLRIKFIVAGDSQYWGGVLPNDDRLARQRTVAYDIDLQENTNDFMGIVMVGDLTNSDEYHQIVAFRQMYECNYKGYTSGCIPKWWGTDCDLDNGDYVYYSGRVRVESKTYPLLGNHDDNRGVNYIQHRMEDSNALFDGKDVYGNQIINYCKENYAWEWGSVHCLSLGPWAFDGSYYNEKKSWLKEHLEDIGKEKPILLFQHYGFDGFSKEDRWWNDADREAFINVICDRESSDDVCNPYNVVALFTGHAHAFDYISDILDPDDDGPLNGQGPRAIPNFVVDDAGVEGGDAGYYFVTLEVDEDGKGTTTVHKRIFKGPGTDRDWDDPHGDDLTYIELGLDDHPNGWDIDWQKDYKIWSYLPSFIRFRLGEPNNADDNQDCVAMESSGRYVDLNCGSEYHALCYDWMEDVYTITEEKMLQLNPGNAWNFCSGSEIFTEPKTPGEQRRILDLMQEQGVERIWVNYSDQRKEGHFEEIPFFKQYFSSSQPNNGDLVPDWSFGENCAHLEKHPDGTINLNDTDCETGYSRFQCWDVANHTFMVSEAKGYWAQGWEVCAAEGYEFNFPSSVYYYQKMLNEISNFFDENGGEKLWVNYNDINIEGRWFESKEGWAYPWLLDTGGWANSGEPKISDTYNCAALNINGWYAQECKDKLRRFACRNINTGEWKASEGLGFWNEGFSNCRAMGAEWYFEYPMRKAENDALHNLVTHLDEPLWMNLTDEREEGVWRHGYWTNWGPSEPCQQYDCAIMITYPELSGLWMSTPCDSSSAFGDGFPALCRIKDPNDPNNLVYAITSENVNPHWKSNDACRAEFGPDAWHAKPYSETDTQVIKDLNRATFMWIRYSDGEREGFWESEMEQ